MSEITAIRTLGGLKKIGYESKSVKQELRDNLIEKLKNKETAFEGVLGYDNTVMPELERAILSQHNINLLGLRGQAKTRIARGMIGLLDEFIPVVQGSELNEDPFHPILASTTKLIEEKGEETPITWLHRSERYAEKLATPDVTVADLIGDADPIKAANLKLDYSDERVIHYGLVPRANRCIFVINELPDLQPRIQVALFNILQEGDVQIRGFKIRLPLDVHFVFTANPEDYTNRGAIITPLKDRIQSQIVTHYPRSLELSRAITDQEAGKINDRAITVSIPNIVRDLVEQVAFEARDSEFIDQKSGVSARLTITAFENLISTVERRAIINGESKAVARVSDLYGTIPAITGKVELVYEGEQEGPVGVAHHLIGKAIRSHFPTHFPDPELAKKRSDVNDPYRDIVGWFDKHEFDLMSNATQDEFEKELFAIPALADVVKIYIPDTPKEEQIVFMEFVLHGLAEYSRLSRSIVDDGFSFSDLFRSVFSIEDEMDE